MNKVCTLSQISQIKGDRQHFLSNSRWRDSSLLSGLILYSRIELITTSSEFLKVVLLGPLFRITNSEGGGGGGVIFIFL